MLISKQRYNLRQMTGNDLGNDGKRQIAHDLVSAQWDSAEL